MHTETYTLYLQDVTNASQHFCLNYSHTRITFYGHMRWLTSIYIYMNIYTYKFATWKNKNLHNFCSYESMLKSNNVYHISFTSIKWTWHYISPLGTFLTWYYSLHFVAKLQWLWKTLNNQGEPQIVKFKEKSAVCRYKEFAIDSIFMTGELISHNKNGTMHDERKHVYKAVFVVVWWVM